MYGCMWYGTITYIHTTFGDMNKRKKNVENDENELLHEMVYLEARKKNEQRHSTRKIQNMGFKVVLF